MRINSIYILILLLAVLSSCGSRKATRAKSAPVDAALAAVVEQHYGHENSFRTLQGKLRLQYETEERTQNVTVSFRMKKGDTIWMSGQLLGIPLAKVLITPSEVQFYEKISQKYFKGDFALLSKLLGTPLDYQKVENLLLGQALYDLRKDAYVMKVTGNGYRLEPSQTRGIKKLFLLDAQHFKAVAQQLGDEFSNRSVTITYPEYQKIGQVILPEQIEIMANEGSESTRVEMEFRGIDLNVPVFFPFEIPSGYEEIEL